MAVFPQSRVVPRPVEIIGGNVVGAVKEGLSVAATVAYALISARRPSVGTIAFDCTLQEEHGWDNDIPGVPVQRNVTENDTIIRRPDRLTMVGVISDLATAFKDQHAMASVAALYDHSEPFSNLSNRQTAWARLQALDRTHEPFEVYTDLALYKDMVFSSVRLVEQRGSDMLVRMVLSKFEQVNVRTQNHLSSLIEDVGSDPDQVGTSNATDSTEGVLGELDEIEILGATG